MNRLLQRQIKRSLGKEYDITTLPSDIQKLLQSIDSSYDDFEKERTFLEHTLDVSSEELTEVNKLIKHQNVEALLLLEQYKYAIDSAMIVSKSDIHGNITYVNDTFCKLSGYSEEELLGSAHSIVRHKDTPPETFKALWNRILNKQIWQGTLKNCAKDGSTYYVNATIVPVLDTQGDIIEFIALREDITQRFILEKEAQRQQQRTQQIMNAQESMIVISDDIDGVLEANQKFYDTTGYENFNDFRKQFRCVCELFIEKEGYLKSSSDEHYWAEPILNHPKELHRAILLNNYGEEVIFDVRGRLITLDDQTYVVSTFSNITEVENMRSRAEDAQKAKSDFLANMSHEIRTPMNGISGFLQLLEKTELTPTQTKYLDITQSSVKTLLCIINDILDFSKIESGKMISDIINVNPFNEFENAFITFAPKAREKNISYQIHLDGKMSESLLVDTLHIRQVMQNLINNAIKFTPEQGTIVVSIVHLDSTQKHDKLRFGVRDTGIGIAKENHSKILEAFSQADNSTTRKFGGTGLGLSISKSLVSLMGGSLQLQSDTNEGSYFYFDLELEKSTTHIKLAKHLESKIICVIDNKDTITQNICTQLSNFNIEYKLCIPHNIPEFLDNYQQCHLVISSTEAEIKYFKNSGNTILINEETQLQSSDTLFVIDSYKECPSQLYNMLLKEEFIPQVSAAIEPTTYHELNILIAEDYEMNRILIEELLKAYEGIHFNFAFDGEEALSIIENNKETPFDLIFMDINMPNLDGIETTKILRKKGCTTPIVALTANALDGDREHFLEIGMNDYLSKPLDLVELERVLNFYSSQKEPLSNHASNSSITIEETTDDAIQRAIEYTKKNTKFPEQIVIKRMKSYIRSFQTLLNSFEEGIKDSNYDQISRAAHDLKSSSLTVGFLDIGEEAKQVELKAAANEPYHNEQSLNIFKDHYKNVMKFFDK